MRADFKIKFLFNDVELIFILMHALHDQMYI